MTQTHLDTGRKPATTLDVEDYAAARATLAEKCVYDLGPISLNGPDAVIASYKANGDTARTRFDAIEY